MRNALVCLVAIVGLDASQAGTGVSAAQAAPFLGDWTVSASSPAFGAQTYLLSLTRSGETVRATIKAPNQAEIKVSDIRVSDKSLVLSYAASYPGMTIPTVLILTPETTAGSANPPGNASLRADM